MLKRKATNSQKNKEILKLGIFSAAYASELGALLVQKGLISVEEEETLTKIATLQATEETKNILNGEMNNVQG